MLLLVALVLAVAKSGTAQSGPILDIPTSIQTELNFLFFNNFSTSCMSQGCPMLRNSHLCPSNSNTNVDQQILNILAQCFTRQMCGVVMDPASSVPLTFSTDQVLPGLSNVIKGQCLLLANETFMKNLSKQAITVTTNPSNSEFPLTITTIINNITVNGAVVCSFNLLLNPDSSSASTTINLPPVSIYLQFNYTSQIMASGTDFSKAFQVFYSNVVFQNVQFYLPDLFPNLDFGKFFSLNLQGYVQQGGVSQALASTLISAYRTAFQVASSNCS